MNNYIVVGRLGKNTAIYHTRAANSQLAIGRWRENISIDYRRDMEPVAYIANYDDNMYAFWHYDGYNCIWSRE